MSVSNANLFEMELNKFMERILWWFESNINTGGMWIRCLLSQCSVWKEFSLPRMVFDITQAPGLLPITLGHGGGLLWGFMLMSSGSNWSPDLGREVIYPPDQMGRDGGFLPFSVVWGLVLLKSSEHILTANFLPLQWPGYWQCPCFPWSLLMACCSKW